MSRRPLGRATRASRATRATTISNESIGIVGVGGFQGKLSVAVASDQIGRVEIDLE